MFRLISTAGFIIVIAGIAIHCAIFRPRFGELFGKDRPKKYLDILRVPAFLLTLCLLEQKKTFLGVLRKLVFLLALLSFAVLLVTGFCPALFLKKTIYGYWLMLHATFGPVLAVCIALLAVMAAHNFRFDRTGGKLALAVKLCFWILLLTTLPLALSIILSMFRLFGTDAQDLLLDIHRYSAVVFALVAIIYIYLNVRARMNQ